GLPAGQPALSPALVLQPVLLRRRVDADTRAGLARLRDDTVGIPPLALHRRAPRAAPAGTDRRRALRPVRPGAPADRCLLLGGAGRLLGGDDGIAGPHAVLGPRPRRAGDRHGAIPVAAGTGGAGLRPRRAREP